MGRTVDLPFLAIYVARVLGRYLNLLDDRRLEKRLIAGGGFTLNHGRQSVTESPSVKRHEVGVANAGSTQ